MDKKAMIHLHREIICGCIKEEAPVLETTWINLDIIMLSEISHFKKKERNRYHMILLIYEI